MASRAQEARTNAAAATTVMSNSVTPYMTVGLRVSEGRLSVDWTEATLGVIPRRRRSLEVEVDEIRELRIAHHVFPLQLLIAIALIGAAVFAPPWARTLLLPVAVWFVLVGIVATLRITWDAGRVAVPVCALQRHRLRAFLAAAAAGRQGEGP